MYKVVESRKDQGHTVYLDNHPVNISGIIYLDLANQKELKYLFESNHPFVYKDEESKAEIKKPVTPVKKKEGGG